MTEATPKAETLAAAPEQVEVLKAGDKGIVVRVSENATASEQSSALLNIIREVALLPDANNRVDAVRAMMEMQRQLVKDQAERLFNQELAALASELPRIKKRGKVEYLEDPKGPKDGPKKEAFKHAKWEDIDAAIRPLLIKHGFSLSFTTEPRTGDGGGLTMVGRLSHREGHFVESRLAVALDSSGGKNNIQGMGSSSSYGKRYVTCNLLNIITEGEDDDGTGAEPITTEQAVQIDLRIVEVKADKAKFLEFMKTDSVLNIRAKDFKKAVTMLDKKAKENAEKAANQKKGAA